MTIRSSIRCFVVLFLLSISSSTSAAVDSVYQWAVVVAPTTDQGNRPQARAYLWIPEHCEKVKAVVVGQHNMLEEDILDHSVFRKAMAELGIAIVWVSPSMDARVATAESIKRFDAMLHDLATISGYYELASAPVIPIGHSAHASYPWNFAAWAPARTLCILFVHGDAPQTPLAGFGPQHIQYPPGALDGVPGLMVMGEYEWLDARWAPATVYRTANLKAPIAMLAEPGEGHFAACDDLVKFLVLFIRKSMEQRLSGDGPALKPIDPAAGWLVQRWKPGIGRTIVPAQAADYGGDSVDAFWAFDQEMADAIQNYHAVMVGKSPELIGFMQDGKLIRATATHPMVTLKFHPQADGETFAFPPVFLETVTTMGTKNDFPAKNNHMRWTGLAAGAPIGHASGGGPITVNRIEGPVEEISPNTFRLQFYRGSNFEKPIAWFAARHPGDDHFKSAVQQATMEIPTNKIGADQTITFDSIADVPTGTSPMKLSATSSAGLPVHFFVREGAATIDGNTLRLLPLPAHTRYPVEVTIVAWQFGQGGDHPVKTAAAVEQTFHITCSR